MEYLTRIIIAFIIILIAGCQTENTNKEDILLGSEYEGSILYWQCYLYTDSTFVYDKTFLKRERIKGKWKNLKGGNIILQCPTSDNNNDYCDCGIIQIMDHKPPFRLKIPKDFDNNYLKDIERLPMPFFIGNQAYFDKLYKYKNIKDNILFTDSDEVLNIKIPRVYFHPKDEWKWGDHYYSEVVFNFENDSIIRLDKIIDLETFQRVAETTNYYTDKNHFYSNPSYLKPGYRPFYLIDKPENIRFLNNKDSIQTKFGIFYKGVLLINDK